MAARDARQAAVLKLQSLEYVYAALAKDRYRFSPAVEAQRSIHQRLVTGATIEYLNSVTAAYGGILPIFRTAHRIVQNHQPSILRKAFVRGSGSARHPDLATAVSAVLKYRATKVQPAKLMTMLALTARNGLDVQLRAMGLVQKASDGIDWTTPVDTWRELFPELFTQVRDYVSHAVGENADQVANLLVNAADYNNPETISNVVRQLREDVGTLNSRQARMIARTETARVYGSTAHQALLRNNVPQRRWLTIASGTAGGVRSSSMRGLNSQGRGGRGQICDYCLENSSAGWVPMTDPFPSGDMAPPIHPWDRCDIAGDYRGWLPPMGDDGAPDVWPMSEFGDDIGDEPDVPDVNTDTDMTPFIMGAELADNNSPQSSAQDVLDWLSSQGA